MQIVTVVRMESRQQGHASPGSRNHKDQPIISRFDLLDKHSGQEFYPRCFYIRETNTLPPGPKSSLVSWLISDLKIQFSCVSLWFYFPARVLDTTLSCVVRMKRGDERQVRVSLGLGCGTKPSKNLLPIQMSRRLSWLPGKSSMLDSCLWQRGTPHALSDTWLLYSIPFLQIYSADIFSPS